MEKNMRKIFKSTKGITLIALVITIIVLLILAGVSLSAVFSQDGIFSRAELAAIKYENQEVYESLTLQAQDYKMEDYEIGTKTKLFDRFKEDGYINEDGTVNMTKLSGGSKTGKGSLSKGDVYVVKQIEEAGDYYLFYYDEKNQENNLGKIFENTVIEPKKTLVSMFKKAQEDNCLDGKTCANFEEHVHIGDYVVNYNSTLKNSSASADLLSEETGIEGVTQTYSVDNSTTWRVAGLNKDGTQLIITSGSPIKKQMDLSAVEDWKKDPYLYLMGAEGWYHTNDELTNDNILDRASKIYDSRYAAKIASMRIEDIETLLELSIERNGANTKAYKTVNGTKTELGSGTNQHFFGQSHTYENGQYAPENYLKEKYPSNSKYASLQAKEAENSIAGSAYIYNIADASVVDPSSKIFDVLFKDATAEPNSKSFWLASSGVGFVKDDAYFGPGFVKSGYVHGGADGVFHTLGYAYRRGIAVRPVVYLQANVSKKELQISPNGNEEPWTTGTCDPSFVLAGAGQIS